MRRLIQLIHSFRAEKGTEKHLFQVLTASLCSMLLCIGCFTGTTYAWFKTTIVSQVNEIGVGEAHMVVSLAKGDKSARASLEPGQNYSYELDEVGTYNFFVINTGNLPGYCVIRITNNLGESEDFSSGTLYPSGNKEGNADSVTITLTITGEDIRNDVTPLTLEVFPTWGNDPNNEKTDVDTQIFEQEEETDPEEDGSDFAEGDEEDTDDPAGDGGSNDSGSDAGSTNPEPEGPSEGGSEPIDPSEGESKDPENDYEDPDQGEDDPIDPSEGEDKPAEPGDKDTKPEDGQDPDNDGNDGSQPDDGNQAGEEGTTENTSEESE